MGIIVFVIDLVGSACVFVCVFMSERYLYSSCKSCSVTVVGAHKAPMQSLPPKSNTYTYIMHSFTGSGPGVYSCILNLQ